MSQYKHMRLSLLFVLMSLIVLGGTTAQDINSDFLVQTALTTTEQLCANTGRDQVCYGHNQVQAWSHPDVAAFVFDEVGDIEDVAKLQSLRLGEMALDQGSWGIALMKLRANMPTAVTEDVTLLAFGGVQIENAVATPMEVTLTTTTEKYVSVYAQPDFETQVMAVIAPGATVTAVERLADNRWLRVKLPEAEGTGWVYVDWVTGDSQLLPETVSTQPYLAPMQAFYFRTDDPGSALDAPSSGLLIQTPEGAGEVTFLMNEINIQIGSTVYFTSFNNDMTVYVLEGKAHITAQGSEQIVTTGLMSHIALTDNLEPAAPPAAPRPFTAQVVQGLPLDLLGQQIVIQTFPIDEQIVDDTTTTDGVPPAADQSAVSAPTASEDEVIPPSDVVSQPAANDSDSTDTAAVSSDGDAATAISSEDAPVAISGEDTPAVTSSEDTTVSSSGDDDTSSEDDVNKFGCEDGNSCNAPGHNKEDDKDASDANDG